MKSFRVKDLMINVMACQGCTLSCNAHPTCAGCTVPVATCGIHCSLACTHACTAACSQACTHACTAVCTGACSFVACTHGCTPACTHACTVVCTYVCTNACTHGCTAVCTFACTIAHTCVCSGVTCVGCTHQPLTCHPSVLPPIEGEEALTNLAELKDQLKKQLAAVEEQEQATEAGMQPQTVSQVDQLVQKLQDAIEELKKQRVTLAEKEAKEKQDKKNQKK